MRDVLAVPGVSFLGAVAVERLEAGGLQVWRINPADHALHDPTLLSKAAEASGVRLAIRSDTQHLRLRARLLDRWRAAEYDLTCDGVLVATVRVPPQEPVQAASSLLRDVTDALTKASKEPADEHEANFELARRSMRNIELWLPTEARQTLLALEVDAGAAVEPIEDTRPLWVAYGSSITQSSNTFQMLGVFPAGSCSAASPSRTWPAVAASCADVNFCNLGFGGNCVLDAAVALQIAALPASCISIKAGINVHNVASHSLRSFRQALLAFIHIIREHQPTVPIAVISPLFGSWREDSPPSREFYEAPEYPDPRFPTLKQVRSQMQETVQLLRERGDAHLEYIDGLEIIGCAEASMMPDGLHLGPAGHEHTGRRMAELLFGPSGVLLPGRAPADP